MPTSIDLKEPYLYRHKHFFLYIIYLFILFGCKNILKLHFFEEVYHQNFGTVFATLKVQTNLLI